MISEATLLKWEKMVAEYKQDHTRPNPFEEPEAGMLFPPHSSQSFADMPLAVSVTLLRREFLQEESDARKRGVTFLHETTPTTFLRRALDVEEQQY